MKKLRLLKGITTALISVLLLSSCSNLLDDGDDSPNSLYMGGAVSQDEIVNFTGTVSLSGAYPNQIIESTNAERASLGRSALPGVGSITYTATATSNKGEPATGIFPDNDHTKKSFTIGLTINRTWTITVTGQDSAGQTILSASTEPFEVSRETGSTTKDFILKPGTSGTGDLALTIGFSDSRIAKVEVICESDNKEYWTVPDTYDISSSDTQILISKTGIKSGIYEVTISFKDTNGFLLYSTNQTINVFDKMTTNKWRSGGSSSSPINDEDNTFALTPAIISNFARTLFYVGKAAVEGDDTNGTGSAYAPFATLGKAITAIKAANHAEDYKIFIGGTVNGCTEIPATLTSASAKSITISGITGNATDILDGKNESSVLSIATAVPVIIQNLKITNGRVHSGGGISITGSADVTLKSGAYITGNVADNGAGIYLEDGTLKVTGSPVVYGNKTPGNTSNNIYLETGRIITVTGKLNAGTKLGITSAATPSIETPVTVTSGYGTHNSGVNPSTYFIGDEYGVTFNTAGTEAIITPTGGHISVASVYDDITISIDKTYVLKTAASKTFTFIPAAGVTYTYEVTCHGDTLSPASTYYTTDANTLTFLDTMTAGNYSINVTAIYKEKKYCAGFEVMIKAPPLLSTLTEAPTSGEYSLSTSEDFAKIAEWSNAKSLAADVTYILDADITLSDWNISSSSKFKGILDGNGHKITIESLSSGTRYILGQESYGGTVKNLIIEGTVTGQYLGIAEEFNYSSVMENVVNKVNVNYTGNSPCAGLFLYCGNSCTIINCRNEGNIYAPNANKVGGIYAEGACSGIPLIGCVNTGNITGKTNVGGISGVSWASIRDCRNEGIITGEDIVGGIVGDCHESNGERDGLNNCINTGTVKVIKADGSAGGICGTFGTSSRNGVVKNCVNLGSVQADSVTTQYLGGITGKVINNDFTYFKNNYYIGNGSLKGAGSQADTSGVCDKFTKTASSCNVASSITVGSYTGTDVVELLNAWVSSCSINFSEKTKYPLKTWKYGSGGNIEYDE